MATLLERDNELASIDRLIEEAKDGRAHLALVEGPAGIGKSRLLAEIRRRAADETFLVLAARGSEHEREFPFGVVRQLFEPLVSDPARREELLSGSAAGAAAVFAAPGELDPADGDSSFASLHGLYWLAVNLSERQPLLLAIDDLHWTDASSLRFLAYLARRLEGIEMLVAVTRRPAEEGASATLLAELVNDPIATTIRPRPLGLESVSTMVRERLGDTASDAFCSACIDTTRGNPLLLEELVRTLESEGVQPTSANIGVVKTLGPKAASRSVLVRLARLDPDSVAVARAAAILGEGTDIDLVAELAGLEPARAAEATGKLAKAEILRPEAPLGFVHPLVQAAIYADLPPGEREIRHAQAAALLREQDAPAERIATHILAMPPRGQEWVVSMLHRAGREAIVKGAIDSAVAYLERALQEPPDPERRTRIVFELGMVQSLVSVADSVAPLREAYERLDDAASKGLAAAMLARGLLFTEQKEESLRVTEEAIAAMPPDQTDLRAALQVFRSVAAIFGIGDFVETRKALVAQLDELDESSLGWKFTASLAALDATFRAEPVERCLELATKALAGGDLIRGDSGLSVFGAINAYVFADSPEVDRHWQELLEECHRRGSLFGISGLHMWQGHGLARRGELSDAEEMLLQARDEFNLYGYGSSGHVYLRAFLAACKLDRGDLAGAKQYLGEDPDLADHSDAANFWLYAKVRILLAEGKDEEVIAACDRLMEHRPYTPNPAVFRPRSPKAIALNRLGRRDEALEVSREEVEIARGYGGPTALGHALRVLGQITGGEEGIALLEESVAVLDGSIARLELAESLSALGTALRLERKPSDAREPLGRALEIASVCGAEQVAERARSELYATGARPRREALQGVESLTPSEMRVATLASEGNSNREIAQELFVTPKTVEVHLSNTYRKLGIKGRRELPTALDTEPAPA